MPLAFIYLWLLSMHSVIVFPPCFCCLIDNLLLSFFYHLLLQPSLLPPPFCILFLTCSLAPFFSICRFQIVIEVKNWPSHSKCEMMPGIAKCMQNSASSADAPEILRLYGLSRFLASTCTNDGYDDRFGVVSIWNRSMMNGKKIWFCGSNMERNGFLGF